MTREQLETIVNDFCAGPYFSHLSSNPDAKRLLVDLAERVAATQELAVRTLEAKLVLAEADRDVLAKEVKRLRPVYIAAGQVPTTLAVELEARGLAYSCKRVANLIESVVAADADATDVSGALSRAGGDSANHADGR